MSYIGLRRAVNERGGREGGRGAEQKLQTLEREEDGRQTRGEEGPAEQADPRRPGGRAGKVPKANPSGHRHGRQAGRQADRQAVILI